MYQIKTSQTKISHTTQNTNNISHGNADHTTIGYDGRSCYFFKAINLFIIFIAAQH